MEWNAFTKEAKQAIRYARRVARDNGQPTVGSEYLLLGLLRVENGVAGQILRGMAVDEDKVRKLIDGLALPEAEFSQKELSLTPEMERILEAAVGYAESYDSELAGTGHLLLAVIFDRESAAAQLLQTLGVNAGQVYTETLVAMGHSDRYSKDKVRALKTGREQENGRRSMLERFTTDLTAAAAANELDPLIGRETELRRVIQILSRRGKNNPCLIGEPGVGKTAIVEGLAQYIARGAAPEHLQNKRILALDIPGMVAGTEYRGQFEERMKGLLREVQETGDVVLFIDELHTIIGAGGAEGALDAANIMKPALSRGLIRVIGATTVEEYRKHVEKDAALERRFQSVTVEEPDVEQTVRILMGLRERYERYHHVVITDAGVRAAAELSARYINERFLPDKAIDLLDEAASGMHLGDLGQMERLAERQEEMNRLGDALESALANGDFSEVARIRAEKQKLTEFDEKELRTYRHKLASGKHAVDENEVAAVVAQWTHIPVKRLTESESARLNRLEKTLHKRVVAQDEAVSAVAKAVRRGRVGLKDPSRPIGSFLFLGPTGVGKTEVSKALAEAVFGTESAIIRIDMSEYMEKHSVSKLIGSPPGYVGYDEGGQLSEQVRRHPYAVVLFDEIEKAHPDVFNLLLQVLDDGHITDSQGRRVDFKNTIIIMTSNAGAKSIVEPKKLGFVAHEDEKADYERMKSGVMEEARRIFQPEFLNRIDEIIVFHALTKEHLQKIVSLMVQELTGRCEKQLGIRLKIQSSVKKYIVEQAYDPRYGARPLRRMIQEKLEDTLADEVLSGKISRGGSVTVGVKKGAIVFELTEA